MLHKTRGIVFRQIKYSETSVIAKIYTELFGLQSYLIRGVRNKKSKIKPALLQHLSLVDIVVYHKEKKDIQHIKEIISAFRFTSIPFDIKKSAIVIFLNEILYKSIKEEEANSELFNFLFNSIQILDLKKNRVSNFHLLFLIQLTKFLGFFPKGNFSNENVTFDLQEGIFIKSETQTEYLTGMPFSKYLFDLTNTSFEDLGSLLILPKYRNELLNTILKYYRLHLPGFGSIKSYQVLQAVFNE